GAGGQPVPAGQSGQHRGDLRLQQTVRRGGGPPARSGRSGGPGHPRTPPSPEGAAPGARPSSRSTRSVTSSPPGRPTAPMLSLITWAARPSDSTNSTCPAPRDRASTPTAPDPAYRSSTRNPPNSPHNAVKVPNRPSRARSLV